MSYSLIALSCLEDWSILPELCLKRLFKHILNNHMEYLQDLSRILDFLFFTWAVCVDNLSLLLHYISSANIILPTPLNFLTAHFVQMKSFCSNSRTEGGSVQMHGHWLTKNTKPCCCICGKVRPNFHHFEDTKMLTVTFFEQMTTFFFEYLSISHL